MDEAPKFLCVNILFMKGRGGPPANWERFELSIHRSGTVTVEVSHVGFYTFSQQFKSRLSIPKILGNLSDAESGTAFGWYSIKTEPQWNQIESIRIEKTAWLNQFLNHTVDNIEPRFQQQCRDIMQWCENNPKTSPMSDG